MTTSHSEVEVPRKYGKPRHKFNAKPTVVRGRRYPSKLEAAYAEKLHAMKAAGLVLHWHEQVAFQLPGGVTYRCDFLVFYADGTAEYVETKGKETEGWKIKKRLVEELYPSAPITVVTRVK